MEYYQTRENNAMKKEIKFYGGWHPDLPDCRDVPFRLTFRLPPELPAVVDLRAGCSPVEDQGALGSCTAQALVGALEFLQIKAGLPVKDLSRLFAYFNARRLGGTILWDSGSTIRTVVKAGRKYGVCKESLWPYETNLFVVRPTDACYKEGREHQITAYQRLSGLDEIRACLAMGLPVVFGFAVYEHAISEEVGRSGVLRIPEEDERMMGGHAILAVGYDDNAKTILFRNSWGTSWGQAGYGTMPYAYFAGHPLASDFWAVQATESDLYAMYKISQTEAAV